MRVVFIGPPGAGKGTQCRRLSNAYEIPHLSTGEMLRATRGESALGRLVASYIDDGRLAPDYLVMRIVTKRLAQPDCREGCLFDGFPRTLNQAHLLDEYLERHSERLNVVLHLNVDQEELIRRLHHRATVEDRADDNPDAIAARLSAFQTQTSPILDYYRQQDLVCEIDGMRSPDNVFQQIRAAVESNR